MKYPIVFLSLVVSLAGCSTKSLSERKDSETQPRTAVTITYGIYGHIEQTTAFPATTVYRNKSVIAAPISAFIATSYVSTGVRVSREQLLYNLESKERRAVGGTGNAGIISINAACDGFVIDVQQQPGSYVAEGTTLCTIAESTSLAFEIDVPYEQRQKVRNGDKCVLELPDGTRLMAMVQLPLVTMNTFSQSERIIATAQAPFLPEGLYVKALFAANVQSGQKNMILPESAVQSDETLTRHWVMTLAGDSTVAIVPVEVVGRNVAEIEILSGSLSSQDCIVLTGGYGLENGAKVVVTKEETTYE